jgi:hypothetical protein
VVSGVAGVEAERGCGGVSTAEPRGRGAPRGVDGVPVAGVPEGGGRVARKLLWVEGLCSVESTAMPSGGGA